MADSNDKVQNGRRPAAHSSWPSIKLFYMPEGRLSQTPDEHCLVYCSQSINGRLEKRNPWCRSMCLRRVFAHEVRNVLGFSRHRDAHADGTAQYPLPKEGQIREESPDSAKLFVSGRLEPLREPVPGAEVQYWEEGWYIWYSRSLLATLIHMDLMSLDPAGQTKWLQSQEVKRKQWKEGLQMSGDQPVRLDAPWQDVSSTSDLVRILPPHSFLFRAIGNYLAPTRTLMELVHETFNDGTQTKFAKRVWQTAWTLEPYRFAGAVCSKIWEVWKAGPQNDGEED